MSQRILSFSGIICLLSLSLGCVHNSTKSGSSMSRQVSPRGMTYNMNSPLSNEQKIIQELTGKPASKIPSPGALKNKALSVQHYFAGLRYAENKNYILAIKHFNTVLKKYPKSPEVSLAFAAKAKVYKEMGLSEPAQLNSKLADLAAHPKPLKNKKLSKVQDQTKLKR